MNPQHMAMFYNAIAIAYVKKQGGEMLNDFASVLKNSGETLSIDKLLNMSGNEFMRTNANEVMATTATGFGKEFVELVVLSKELIERLELTGNLLEFATIKTMTGSSVDFPVRGTRTRMVIGGENSTLPAGGGVATQTKRASTKLINLTAGKLTLTIYYSDELLEDSVIDIADYVLTELLSSYVNSMHEIILNGDTDTGATTNINIIDGNTSALPDGNKTDLLLFNGARKGAIDNSGTVSAAANLAVTHIRSARAKMGVKGLDPSKLKMVPDTQTYFKLMNLTPVETMEKFGDSATIKEGKLSAIDGIAIVSREEMGMATATGEISATPANNTKGQIAIIHTPSLLIGVRREFKTELSRYAEEGETGVTGTARVAIGFDNTQNNKEATLPYSLIINI